MCEKAWSKEVSIPVDKVRACVSFRSLRIGYELVSIPVDKVRASLSPWATVFLVSFNPRG